ncbi:hypothetical protein MFUR16E_17030 [Methylobacterium fujisawaense]|uniref:hypothetical protein n=1 Tax=Methylobacterium fujisawaense TaxID=107400 RepID=UPI002F33D7D8
MQQACEEAQRAKIVQSVRSSRPRTLRANDVFLNRIVAKFEAVPEFRLRYLLEEAIARGEIVTLRRSTSTRFLVTDPVVSYDPRRLKSPQTAHDSRDTSGRRAPARHIPYGRMRGYERETTPK